MFNRDFDDFLLALEAYETENTPGIRVEKRDRNPTRIQLQIKDDDWKQNIQKILQFCFINLTGIGAVRQLL